MLSIILVSLDMTAAKVRDYRSCLRRSQSKSAAEFSRAKSGGSGSSGRSQLVRLKTFLKRFSCADRATNSSFGLGHALVAFGSRQTSRRRRSIGLFSSFVTFPVPVLVLV